MKLILCWRLWEVDGGVLVVLDLEAGEPRVGHLMAEGRMLFVY